MRSPSRLSTPQQRVGGGRLWVMAHRVDPFAGTAAVMALVMVVVYIAVIGLQEEGEPAAWFVAALLVGAATAG